MNIWTSDISKDEGYAVGCLLFVQENWPRAATLAPFLGDRFVGTTTPRKTETTMPCNYHGNVVRATETFTLSDLLACISCRELIANFYSSNCFDFHRERSIAKLCNVNTLYYYRFFNSSNIKFWTRNTWIEKWHGLIDLVWWKTLLKDKTELKINIIYT